MKSMFSSTIAAISTPRGKGGIAVIRVSGDEAIGICEKFIFPSKPLSSVEARKASFCKICDASGETLDEGIVTVFRAPHSYTGEDTVEISCHGGEIICREILSRAFECGAVQASAGEFTRRAFSSGKLSLTEAEAVIGMIDAKSTSELKLSRKNLDGKLSKQIGAVYDKIKGVVGSVYAGIDFPDEDLMTLDESGMKVGIVESIKMLEALERSYKAGHAVCEGIPTVICGKPNTGKSTLLNLITGYERAIVTDIAGTTRDVITETVVLGDVTLLLSDTAGIHATSDKIEQIGVEKSIEKINECELLLCVFDISRELDSEDEEIISFAKKAEENGTCVICVMNKSDIKSDVETKLGSIFGNTVEISAKDKDSLEPVKNIINDMFIEGNILQSDGAIVTNARQHASVMRALELCKSAEAALDAFGTDIAGSELERAMSELSELDGREVGIDIVNDIFGRFCVGK